ncbi:16S rRNA (uracil(1498)-N(3))-methyltransferase [Verrucomicrobiaceae bacterium N1E253]|uniref:Ribosomal RNA small subunit methyltransferase E n=1 Tax=Oceaniferula marina TaxID=2748318 RepID=A0A851GD46_9BACT|nr:RsmE family RNA methyltransferase [Oceaniferula marina]NWK55473.1 16S rRNA (uracil(1498)-N(3))-methyltransferase [Oceaniferula marina]
MNRYYLPADSWQESGLVLQGEEAKHCSRVMRARAGDRIEVFDGNGCSAVCEILSVNKGAVACKLLERVQHRMPDHPMTLCQAIPKGGNMELIVQKSVELGVNVIQPLITAHTVARPESLAKKQAKWQRIALEACKQCGQNFLPEVKSPLSFASWVDQGPSFGLALVASLEDRARHVKSLFEEDPVSGSIALLVGPEGDFSEDEYRAVYELGFQPVSFGEIVMRVETATMYGLSVIQHELSAAE